MLSGPKILLSLPFLLFDFPPHLLEITRNANSARRKVVEILRAEEDEIVGQYAPSLSRTHRP